MRLKKHHKWVLGGFGTVVLIYMIVSSILLSGIITKQTINNNQLKDKIGELQGDTQNKLNELTEGLLDTRNKLTQIGTEVGSIGQEFDILKASAGEDFSGIIENSVKAVVTVKTDVGQGTGFIITNNGYLVTNAHVLSGGSFINALTSDQKEIIATLIGFDENLDMALLKIDGIYNYLEVGNSNDIQVGEKVIAIGNPLGLQFSVSEGIVSGIHRIGPNGLDIYIQTDAALNPGNSGGPLINKQGKVIGINNFKLSDGENLGFALESNYMKEAINDISREALSQTILS